MCRFVLLILLCSLSSSAHAAAELRYDVQFILQTIAKKKGVVLKPDIELPRVFLESQTPLEQFQNAIEPQWGMRPDVIVNAFVIANNEIYLIDDEGYYSRLKRFIDDSLAQELVHYIQVKYLGIDLSQDESSEYEAIEIQTWFRETFLTNP